MRKSSARGDWFPSMSFASGFLAFCGFAVVLWLLHENDYCAVLRTVAGVGGGLAVVVLIRGTIIATCTLAWGALVRRGAAARVSVVLGLRTVGEAINALFPVAPIGRALGRARPVRFRGVCGGVAGPSASVALL